MQPVASAGATLMGDLIQRPVPGSDEAANADRFPDDHGLATVLLKLEAFENSDGVDEVAKACRHLSVLAQ